MSRYFDGRNDRLSKTWRIRRSVGTGIVAILPGKL